MVKMLLVFSWTNHGAFHRWVPTLHGTRWSQSLQESKIVRFIFDVRQDAFRKVAEGDKNAMKNELKKENQQVQEPPQLEMYSHQSFFVPLVEHPTWISPGFGGLCTFAHQQAAAEKGAPTCRGPVSEIRSA